MKTWKHVLMTAALLPASLLAAALSGTVVSSPGVNVAGAKVIVYNNAGLTTKQDSATTNAAGAYTVTTLSSSGFSFLVASKAGYHNSAALQRTNSGTAVTGVTITMPIDDSSSFITGRVLRASDSTPVIGATVSLTGGKLDHVEVQTTDSLGVYVFGKVGTSTGYNVSAAASGFTSSSAGSIAVGWNSTTTVGSLFLTRNLGTVSGVVRRADTTAKIISGAKMVFYIGGLKVDSVNSDSLGNYTLQLNATTYTVKSSATGYRGNKGTVTRDTTITINFGATTNLLVYLTPASGTIGGTVTHSAVANPPQQAGNQDSATIYLERRLGTTAGLNTWLVLDSTLSSAGFYSFTGLIPATGNSPANPVPANGTGPTPGGNYRILARANGWVPNYNENQGLVASATPTTVVVLPFAANSTVTSNVNFTNPVVPIFFANKVRQEMRVTLAGDRMLMDLGAASNTARSIEVYDMNGSLRHIASVRAGESQVALPAVFARGFFFKVR